MSVLTPESDAIRQQLIAEIAEAFADVRREDGISIREADVIDRYGSDDEQLAARKLDAEEHWWDVPDAIIERHTGFCFLDLKGLRYYIPAYMTCYLRTLVQPVNSNSRDRLIYSLEHIAAWHEYSHCWANVPVVYQQSICACRFTPAQRAVVRRFLEYIVLYEPTSFDDEYASRALENWEKTEQRIATEVDEGHTMIVKYSLHLPDGRVVEGTSE